MSAKNNRNDDKHDTPRRRGLPSVPRDARTAPTPPIHGSADDPLDGPTIPAGPDPSPGDVPDDIRVRRNGTAVPLIVQKILAIVRAREIRNVALEGSQGASIGENRLYHWRMKAGQPSIRQILRIANFLDVPVEYFIDDDIPVMDPAPRRWEMSHSKIAEAASSAGLSLDVVETYLVAIKVAQSFGLGPEQAINVMATAGVERRNVAEVRPHWGNSGPVAHLDGVTERERQARRDEEDRRRNGGPRPRMG